ncbi:MAG: nickel-dependent lactate racemase family protein [Syntrophales bacterium]
MNGTEVEIPYGTGTIRVTVPEANLMGVYSPNDVPGLSDVEAEIRRSLANPIGSPPFRELVRGKKKVVLVADDITRTTPTDIILPILLNECNAAGVPDSAIAVVIALGTHRFMTEAEIRAKFGAEVLRRVGVKNHPFRDPAAHVDLGTTKNGGRILINREVYEADFKIGIGSIVPHHICGFSGGAKIVQPGVSGEATTAYTHLLSVRAPRSWLGVLDNPIRAEMDEIARRIGLTTIINTVPNRRGEVAGAFFGDVTTAFAAGVQKAVEVYAVRLPEEADIVLAGSHPCDIDFWQAHKTQYPADLAVKAGGIIIIVTPCDEGVAPTHCAITEITCRSAGAIRDMVAAGRLSDEVAAALAIAWAQVRQREEVFLVSQGIGPAEARKLGFTRFATAQAALDEALRRRGPSATVAVLTHAPEMLPVIDNRETAAATCLRSASDGTGQEPFFRLA